MSLLQFLEGAPDRQAVELLRYHAGWNFALNRSLGDEVFDPSALVYFRRRLVEHHLSAVIFKALLDGLVRAVERRGKQRLDSTQMMGLLRWMSRLEIMRESLRLVLQELEASAAGLARPELWAVWIERYVDNKLDYRSNADALKSKMDQAGRDALELLQWLDAMAQGGPREGRQTQLLRRAFKDNFQVIEQAPRQREAQPPGSLQNPHEPDAQRAAKGEGKPKKVHIGYKVQVAETVQDQPVAKGEPTRSFLTAVLTQPAIASEDAGLEKWRKSKPTWAWTNRRNSMSTPATWMPRNSSRLKARGAS